MGWEEKGASVLWWCVGTMIKHGCSWKKHQLMLYTLLLDSVNWDYVIVNQRLLSISRLFTNVFDGEYWISGNMNDS